MLRLHRLIQRAASCFSTASSSVTVQFVRASETNSSSQPVNQEFVGMLMLLSSVRKSCDVLLARR